MTHLQVDRLKELVAASACRHAAEILLKLAAPGCVVAHSATVQVEDLKTIYSQRLRHLRSFSTPHTNSLREDVAALLEGLLSFDGTTCELFCVRSETPEVFGVFASGHDILGCTGGIDRGKLTSAEWESLWAPAAGPARKI
jgi:hypothetical protein